MTLIEKIQSVVNSYSSFEQQLLLILEQQAKTPDYHLNYAVDKSVEILQVQSIFSTVESAKVLLQKFRGCEFQATLARIHATTAIDSILEKFKTDISNENNLRTILACSEQVKCFIGSYEKQQKNINQKISDAVNNAREKLVQDSPQKLHDFAVYSDIVLEMSDIGQMEKR